MFYEDADGGYCDNISFNAPQARLLASIRVSQVEICWNSLTNRFYSVQYRSELTTNQWTDLLPTNILAVATQTCIYDNIPPDQPQRFYRVVELP